MIGRVSYAVREGEYVVDLDGDNGWTFASAEEAERFAEVFRAAVRYHAEVEREACAALVDAAAEEYALSSPGDDAHDIARNRHAADVLRDVAAAIRGNGTVTSDPIASERIALAASCEREADRLDAVTVGGMRVMGFAAAQVRSVAASIRARAVMRCPETARDGATPAPNAPSPAGGLPVAAKLWCPRCDGSGRRLHEGWREVRCDECRTTGRVVAEGGE